MTINVVDLVKAITDKSAIDLLLRELLMDESLIKLIKDLNAIENRTNKSNSAKKVYETANVVVAAAAGVLAGATSINQVAEMSADLSTTPEVKQATMNNKVNTLFGGG